MSKKLIIIAISIIAIILVTIMTLNDNINSNPNVIEIFDQYSINVDAGTASLMNCSTYKSLKKEEKINEMGDLLRLYEKNGVIANLYYDENGLMFTFTYNQGDIKGSLGGVMLKEWDSLMN